jgi:hypothetical protein
MVGSGDLPAVSSIASDKLHVIAVVSNPRRYESRYKLYRTFEKYVQDSGATLYTVEAAFGARDHEVTSSDNPYHIQVRNSHEVWQKEAMMNIALSRIPKDAKYIAAIDADVRFEREDWAEETIHQLQHHSVVQMFSHAIDLGPSHEAIQYHTGFGFCFRHGKRHDQMLTEGPHWHPGFAWAYRREFLDAVGGFIDTGLLGAGDNHMANALLDKVSFSFPGGISEGYKAPILQWQHRAVAAAQGNLGYVPGVLRHQFHGAKADRQYESRWKILVEEKFDPSVDAYKDIQGLWRLAGNKPRLRDRMMAYFSSRGEDNRHALPFFNGK